MSHDPKGYRAFGHHVVYDDGIPWSEDWILAFCDSDDTAAMIAQVLNVHMDPKTGKVQLAAVEQAEGNA